MLYSKISALALDLDGTLLTSQKQITDDTLTTLRAVLARNIKILVVTGKAPQLTSQCIAPLKLPMVCLDGAVHIIEGIQRWTDGSILEEIVVKDLLTVSEAPCYVIASGVTHVRGVVETNQFIDWSDQVVRLMPNSQLSRITHLVFPSRDRHMLADLSCRVSKISQSLGKNTFSFFLSEEPFFGAYSLFIRSSGCSKLQGMAALARRLNFTLDQTMFIGDWINDIPLLQAVGFPVVMRQAPLRVSICARATTLFTNDEEGVSRFLQSFFLSHRLGNDHQP